MDANDMKLLGKRMPTEDMISREEAIDVMLMAIDDDWEPDYATDRMNELPSAQPESLTQMDQELNPTCTDYISRQVLDLWDRYKPTIAVDAIEYDGELKKLLGTNLAEVGTECISRQAAIDAIDKCAVWVVYTQGDSQKDEAEFAENIIKQTKMAIRSMLREDLPSAQPERKKGKWIRPSRPKSYERICSECKAKAWYCGTGDYNFCPNCGADMRGEQDV